METSTNKEIVVSGIRSTGNLHLGNYFGALRNFVKMQDDYDSRFFIADLHALTTNPDPEQLHANVKNILASISPPALILKRPRFLYKAIYPKSQKCICFSICMWALVN